MFELITAAVAGTNNNTGSFATMLGIFLIFLFFVMLPIYIYSAITLMIIARRTKTDDAWLAWIPFANIYLMAKVAKAPIWSLAFFALMFLPMIGSLAISGMMLWYWWMIAERMNRPGWWGILMLVPILNLILMGILAWGEIPKKAKVSKKLKKAKETKEKI